MEKEMTLKETFMSIEDPRDPSGRRYSLLSIFNMLMAGLVSGHNSLTKIAQWFRTLPAKSAEDLGFSKGRPSIATLSNILRRIPVESVERAIGGCFSEQIPHNHIAIDGKSLRGTTQDTVPLVHLLSAFVVQNQQVINQVKMNEGENEITAALRLIEGATVEGGIITGDAIFAQKKSVKRF
jgi:hypothetical protein